MITVETPSVVSPKPSPAGVHFTPREQEILRLIACDLSDKEIARLLGISQHTIRAHLSRLYLRHGVHSRAAAVAGWLLGGGASVALPSPALTAPESRA